MKIFSTDYLEAMSEDVDGNDWSWGPLNMPKPGRPTKSTVVTYNAHCDWHTDEDQPQEGMASGMLSA